jgi:hypothetical protein
MIVLCTETNIISQTPSITTCMTWDESGVGLLLDCWSVATLFWTHRKIKHVAKSDPSLFVYSLFILTSCRLARVFLLSGLVRQEAGYCTQLEDDQEAAGVWMKLGCKICDETVPVSTWTAGNVEGSDGTRATGTERDFNCCFRQNIFC